MDIKRIYKQIEDKQKEIAIYRDDLRGVLATVEDILDGVECADEELQTALRAIEDAADKLSELQ